MNEVPYTKEKFTFDYLRVKETDETILSAEVEFESKNQYMNNMSGGKFYLDVFYIRELGLSRDGKYQRIATPQYEFFVSPEDVERFLIVLKHRQKVKHEAKAKMKEREILNQTHTFEYDAIDDDIYYCFIAYKSGMCDAIGKWAQFFKVEEVLRAECEKNGGKYLKKEGKTAKFAILFNPGYRVYSVVADLREKGLKVTTFEAILRHFNWTKMFSIEQLEKHIAKIEEYAKKSAVSEDVSSIDE